MEQNQNQEMVTISKTKLQLLERNNALYSKIYSDFMEKYTKKKFLNEFENYKLEINIKLNNDSYIIYEIPEMDELINEFQIKIEDTIHEYIEEGKNEIEIEFEGYTFRLIE